jgi:hypothetical protein
VAFELVYPIASLENRGPVETLKRSWNLTKGYRWNIFAATLVMGLLCGAVNIPAGIGTSLISLHVWPLEAALGMVVDIASEATTVLSLVIYLSILASHRGQQTVES